MLKALTRESMEKAWAKYYGMLDPADIREVAQVNADACLGRMRRLGKERSPLSRGFRRGELNKALSMALSIHKQVLGRLPSDPGVVIMEQGGGGDMNDDEATESLPSSLVPGPDH